MLLFRLATVSECTSWCTQQLLLAKRSARLLTVKAFFLGARYAALASPPVAACRLDVQEQARKQPGYITP